MTTEAAVAWLRKQIEDDMSAATIISDGGYAPERWDTDPRGQVNPPQMPEAHAITLLLDPDADDPAFPRCEHWTALHAWERENHEGEDERVRESGLPVSIVNNGRRELDHISRHDPLNVVADCEAKLAILDEHGPESTFGPDDVCCTACGDVPQVPWPCKTVGLIASAYRRRDGYAGHWGAGA